MNILVVSQYFHPEPFRISDLVIGLKERGHVVTVLTGIPNYPDGKRYAGYGWSGWSGLLQEDFNGIKVIRVPLVTRGSSKNWRLALNYLSFAFAASLLGPLRCRGRFDLVFVYEPSPITVGLPGLLMGALKRAPVMLWIQDLWPDTLAAMGRRGTIFRVAAVLAEFIHRHCDRLLVQSTAFIQPLLARGISATRVRYLPNWAEAFYRPGDLQPVADLLARFTGLRIVFAGNLGSAQSIETITAAAEQLRDHKDIHWIIIGDGLMRKTIEAHIRERRLGATVTLLGRHPPESMPRYFAAADALLVTLRPDPVFALTIPSKIQSYLAAGRLIIGALDGEGARIIEESGGGFTCAAGNARALADLVLQVSATAPSERAAMGARGRAYFEAHFERNRLLDRLDNWIHELTEQPHANSDTRR